MYGMVHTNSIFIQNLKELYDIEILEMFMRLSGGDYDLFADKTYTTEACIDNHGLYIRTTRADVAGLTVRLKCTFKRKQ